MFGWLKRKKDDDFGDIRSHVLGEPDMPPADDDVPNFDTSRDADRAMKRGSFGRMSDRFGEPREPAFDDPYANQDVGAPPGFEQPMGPSSFQQQGPNTNVDIGSKYEILDRLKFIESQLAAVRSQVELANERLKNMEGLLNQRRY
ncbi:MAG: hypothetical protein HY832_00105 [Candidatus Aenigmarchaeota archaeon]|nr:hypothetical protein [Candidatus Aenigmarchaeota archaeon]